MSESSPSSPAVFDADQLATEPPELRIGGRVYRGRILSIVEWARWQKRFEEAGIGDPAALVDAAGALDAMQSLFAEYLRAVLPIAHVTQSAPRTDRIGRLFRRRRTVTVPIDPIAQLEAVDPLLVVKAFPHFFAHQCHAMGLTRRPPTATATTTDGTRSPDRTTEAPSAAPASD